MREQRNEDRGMLHSGFEEHCSAELPNPSLGLIPWDPSAASPSSSPAFLLSLPLLPRLTLLPASSSSPASPSSHVSFSQHSCSHLLPTLNLQICSSSSLVPLSILSIRLSAQFFYLRWLKHDFLSQPSQHASVLGHCWDS